MKITQPMIQHTARMMLIMLGCLSATRVDATTLFDNTSATADGVLTADAQNWYAAMFTTSSDTITGLSASLLLAESAAGTPRLDLYSDVTGLEPDSLIASFTSPASFSSTAQLSTFTATGLSLDANTNYWLVLHSDDGTYDWSWRGSWTDDADLQPWAESNDAGGLWFGGNAYPFIYSVSTLAVPEPTTIGLLSLAFLAAASGRFRFRPKRS